MSRSPSWKRWIVPHTTEASGSPAAVRAAASWRCAFATTAPSSGWLAPDPVPLCMNMPRRAGVLRRTGLRSPLRAACQHQLRREARSETCISQCRESTVQAVAGSAGGPASAASSRRRSRAHPRIELPRRTLNQPPCDIGQGHWIGPSDPEPSPSDDDRPSDAHQNGVVTSSRMLVLDRPSFLGRAVVVTGRRVRRSDRGPRRNAGEARCSE